MEVLRVFFIGLQFRLKTLYEKWLFPVIFPSTIVTAKLNDVGPILFTTVLPHLSTIYSPHF
jgi:hypothetical protein